MDLTLTLRRRRVLLAATVLLFAYSQRNVVLRILRRIIGSVGRVLDAADDFAATLSRASADLNSYLYPPPSSGPCPTHATHARCATQSSSTARRCTVSTAIPTRTAITSSASSSPDEDAVPRSVRRLLKLAATPEGLMVMRTMAAGAAQGAVREVVRDDGRSGVVGHVGDEVETNAARRKSRIRASGNSSGTKSIDRIDSSGAARLLAALATPGGERLVTAVVAAAVREVFAGAMDRMPKDTTSRNGKNAVRDIVPQVLDAVTSPRGRSLMVDIVATVTRIATPILVHNTRSGTTADLQNDDSQAQLYPIAVPSEQSRGTDRSTSTQLKSALSFLSRRKWLRGVGPSSRSEPPVLPAPPRETPRAPMSTATDAPSSAATQLLSVARGTDKELLRDLVRAASSEAVRSYLTTQADLKFSQRRGRSSSRSRADGVASSGFGVVEEARDQNESQPQGDSEDGDGGNSSWTGWRFAQQVATLLVEPFQLRGVGETGWLLL